MMKHQWSKLLIVILSTSALAFHIRIRTDNHITNSRPPARLLHPLSLSPHESEFSPRSPQEIDSAPTSDPLDKPSHHFITIDYAILDPVSPAAEYLVLLYSTALAELRAHMKGSGDIAPLNFGSVDGTQALGFKYGNFKLMFRYDGPDGNSGNRDLGLEWGVLEVFCKDIIEKSKRGMPLTFKGWLKKVGDDEDIVFVSMLVDEEAT
ncbi:hypothetical protein G7Y79_00042g078560 [Physcia stellaris]|nr:hypothetical protein G7Y79_00042g078560 [Physcia stellaris]